MLDQNIFKIQFGRILSNTSPKKKIICQVGSVLYLIIPEIGTEGRWDDVPLGIIIDSLPGSTALF